MDINKAILDGLSEEMRAKVGACESPKDLIALADEQGVELTDEQLQAVSGGGDWDFFDGTEIRNV